MPEGSIDAIVLISTSWQALKRAEQGGKSTMMCNCTVVIVFACFFIEANLNQIIAKLGMTDEMNRFLDKKYPGLQDKFAWFYNKYVARDKATNKRQFKAKEINRKLRRKFPGFSEIYNFRNKISHGVIDQSIANLEDAEKLRIKAKEIVDNLFIIASRTGVDIPRNITYEIAISGNDNSSYFNFDTRFIPNGLALS